MKNEIRLIALDLDGTLLNSEKHITPRTREALDAAAAKGIEIVPCTGRLYSTLPEEILSLPYLHYAITVNGATVYDFAQGKTVCSREIELEDALRLMTYFDTLPVIYDCYQENRSFMTEEFYNTCENYLDDRHFLKMIRAYRIPVPELKAYLRQHGKSIQKAILFTKDTELRSRLLRELPEQYPMLTITSSIPHNIEFNQKDAHKGQALSDLTAYLGLKPAETMGFGDGLNDLTLMEQAGLSVCMANGEAETKSRAGYVTTADNDHDGVAEAIERFVLADS